MMPEQRAIVLKRQLIFVSVTALVTVVAANYVIAKQEKELTKLGKAFRTMADVSELFEGYAPPDVIAKANDMLAFATIEIHYDK